MFAFEPVCSAQLFSFSKQDLLDYTAHNPFSRFADGRPKVPDDLIERAKDLSSEEVWEVLTDKKFNNQYADCRTERADPPSIIRYALGTSTPVR